MKNIFPCLFAIIFLITFLPFTTSGCTCGDDDDNDSSDDDAVDDDAADDDAADDDIITDDDTFDDDVVDDDSTDDDTSDDDVIDDDTTDDDSGDDDTTDDDTIDDDTTDDDTYPTHDEIFTISGNVTINGSQDVFTELGLSEAGVIGCRMVFIETTDEEQTEYWPHWDVEPGEPNYCVSLLGGTYDIWIEWDAYDNTNYQWLRYHTQVADDHVLDADEDFDINHVLYAVTGHVQNFEAADVEFQQVWLFTPTTDQEEVFEYYDYTDEDGDYSIRAPTGTYWFSVNAYDESFDIQPYTEENLDLAGTLTKDVTLAQTATGANEIDTSFTVNGVDPATLFDNVDGRMELYDTAHKVTYWDWSNGDGMIYAPDGSYQWQIYLYLGREVPEFSSSMYQLFFASLPISGNTTLPTQNFELYAIEGTVYDSNGDELAETDIDGNLTLTGDYDLVINFSGMSDGDGKYRFDLPAGAYEVTYDPPDTAPYTDAETNPYMQVTADATIDFSFPTDYYPLSGTLTLNGEVPTVYFPEIFTSALFYLVDENNFLVREVLIDPTDGTFSQIVPTGTYDLLLIYQGAHMVGDYYEILSVYWSAYIEDLAITGNTEQDLELTLHEVSGTVTDWNDDGLQYTIANLITAVPLPNTPYVYAESLADADGDWLMYVPTGSYEIDFIPPDCGDLIPLGIPNQYINDDETLNFRFR